MTAPKDEYELTLPGNLPGQMQRGWQLPFPCAYIRTRYTIEIDVKDHGKFVITGEGQKQPLLHYPDGRVVQLEPSKR